MKTLPFLRANRALYGLGAIALVGLTVWGNGAAAKNRLTNVTKFEKLANAAGKLGVLGKTSFTDVTGKTYSTQDITDHKATIFLFVSSQCPISNVYTPRFNALASDYASKGVQVFAVYSDTQESQMDVIKHVKTQHVAFPAVKDGQNALADKLGAKVTPEAIVVDSTGAVRYRGRFDDNAVATRVSKHDVTNAVEAVLKGQEVTTPTQTAFGCAIRRVKPDAKALAGVPTYARDVAPILRAKCESCHRPGEVAPFALQDFKQASAWANDIKTYTQNNQMPPWKPSPDYGAFQDVAAHTLSPAEKTVIAKWADGGAPLGNPKDMPAPRQFTSDWKLGQPDAVLVPTKDYHLGPDGEDVYRNFVVKTNFSEDRWISAIECRPGNRAVVHHIINYLDTNHLADKLEGKDNDGQPGFTVTGGGPGFLATGFLGGWAPGNDPVPSPTGVATLLPKGANLVIQVHYHKNGKPETDQTKIGLYFTHGTVEKVARPNLVINFGFKIPYGDDRHEAKASTTIQEDCHVLSVMPHMHLLGREMKVWATLPDGTEKPLVWIKDWDFNWQGTYMLKEPIALPKGSKVYLQAYYDNSEKNPRNPNIKNPRAVTWGESTTDEMCIAFLTYTKDAEHLAIDTDAKKQTASAK